MSLEIDLADRPRLVILDNGDGAHAWLNDGNVTFLLGYDARAKLTSREQADLIRRHCEQTVEACTRAIAAYDRQHGLGDDTLAGEVGVLAVAETLRGGPA